MNRKVTLKSDYRTSRKAKATFAKVMEIVLAQRKEKLPDKDSVSSPDS